VALPELKTGYKKSIHFIRHAESAGNALVSGMIESGRWDAFKDGKLTKKGTQAVEGKAENLIAIDRRQIETILDAEIVLVSPLRRAMATAIIFMAKAKQLLRDLEGEEDRPGAYSYETRGTLIGDAYYAPDFLEDHLPEIRVHADLREKWSSNSDQPGADGKEDPMQYVRGIAEACGERWFLNKDALEKAVSQIEKTYRAEEQRTGGWQPIPADGFNFAAQVRRFKTYLSGIIPQKVVIVGHNGWSRYAFSAFMPVYKTENVWRNMRFGNRKVLPLRNVGLIQAQFQNGVFTQARVNQGDSSGKGKWALLVSQQEALEQGVVPRNTIFNQILVHREKLVEMKSKYQRHIITFGSWQSGHFDRPISVPTVSWTDKWGSIDDAERDTFNIWNASQLVIRQIGQEPLRFSFRVSDEWEGAGLTDGALGSKPRSKTFNFMLESSLLHGLRDLMGRFGGHLELF